MEMVLINYKYYYGKTKKLSSVLLCFILIITTFLCIKPPVFADEPFVYHVTTSDDECPGSLHEAIDQANASGKSERLIIIDDGVGNILPAYSRLPTLFANGCDVQIESKSSRRIETLYIQISYGGRLTLKDVNIDNSSYIYGLPTIDVMDGNVSNTLLLNGTNTIKTDSMSNINANVPIGCSLAIDKIPGETDSDCALTLSVNKSGLGSGGTLNINGGTINATGLFAVIGTVNISGGNLYATGISYGAGIRSLDTVTISGGTVVASGNSDITTPMCTIMGGSVNARKIPSGVFDANNTQLYLNTVTVGSPAVLNKDITCSINGAQPFSAQTDSAGNLYLWMPETSAGETATAVILDGTWQYVASGSIANNYYNTMVAYRAEVTGVTVSPSSVTVQKGLSQQFTATVTGTYDPPLDVAWSVSGALGSTSISNTGLLTVGADETSNALTVKAASTYDTSKFATASVTVPQAVTVTFDAQGGSAVPSQIVNYNSTITKPADPARSGYSFAGWYTDTTYTTQWNFANDKVTDDVTLYAKWNIVYVYILLIVILPAIIFTILLITLTTYFLRRNQ